MNDRHVRSRKLNGLWTISTVFVVLVGVLSPYMLRSRSQSSCISP